MMTKIDNFDISKVCFLKHEEATINSGQNPIQFKSVPIRIKLDNGDLGPLYIVTDKCFSWGLQTEKNGKSYKLPIVMINKNSNGELEPTDYQTKLLQVFNSIVEKCKDHCLAKKADLEKFDLERSDMKRMGGCLYVKKEFKEGKQVPVENYAPTLYAKVPYNKKKDEILVDFFEMEDVEDDHEPGTVIDPKKYLEQKCDVKVVLNFDSIFVSGTCTSLQVKVAEVNIKKRGFTKGRMMSLVKALPRPLKETTETELNEED